MTKENNFETVKVQPQGAVYLLLIKFQPGVTYKNVAYKKAFVLL